MDEDIIEYFESRGHHIHKLVERKPGRLREEKVMLAISDVYDQIQHGREITNIMLAREVWRKAGDYPNLEMHKRMGYVRKGEASLKKQVKRLQLAVGANVIALVVLIILIILNL